MGCATGGARKNRAAQGTRVGGGLPPSRPVGTQRRFRRVLPHVVEKVAAAGGKSGDSMRTGADALHTDIRGVLGTIQLPTLVMHREGNRYLSVEHGRYLAEHIPGAKYVELPGDDHWVYVGETGVLLDEIEEFLTGTRPRGEPDRVLATVLFTDIVNSTRELASRGDATWRHTLDAHDEAVRRQLARFGGREVRTTGDGFLATFDGPARAIRAGCAIRDLAAQQGLHVRVGLHTGEIELRGDDLVGIAVHIGQRVSAKAQPGEVLVSRTAKDLVAGSGSHSATAAPTRSRACRAGGVCSPSTDPGPPSGALKRPPRLSPTVGKEHSYQDCSFVPGAEAFEQACLIGAWDDPR